MRIIAFPAFKNEKLNPYQFLLYSEIQRMGSSVDEFTIKNVIFSQYDILHVHWPESNKLRKNVFIATIYSILILLLFKISKIKGAKIIWTVHNEAPHDIRHPILTKWFYSSIFKMLDGLIFLNHSSWKKLYHKLDPSSSKFFSIIPHGHYRNYYNNTLTQHQAREILKIDKVKKVILYFGQIRPYKGIDSLIKVFKQIKNDDTLLLICGSPSKEHRSFIDDLMKANSTNIIFDLKFIPNDQIEVYLNASDLVVLPYKQILNSGTILLSLSFNRPVLIPGFDGLIELRDSFGERWIHIYPPDNLNRNVLEDVLSKITVNSNENLDLSSINWEGIAKTTIEFYQKCIEKDN